MRLAERGKIERVNLPGAALGRFTFDFRRSRLHNLLVLPVNERVFFTHLRPLMAAEITP